MPNNTKDKEKNTFIARTATTNSVALMSIYEYHFHASGTKKCHIPKPIEALLPIVTKTLASRFKITPPGNVSSNSNGLRQAFGGLCPPTMNSGRESAARACLARQAHPILMRCRDKNNSSCQNELHFYHSLTSQFSNLQGDIGTWRV